MLPLDPKCLENIDFTLTGVTPALRPSTGAEAQTLTLSGTNLDGVVSVKVGTALASITSVSPTAVVATLPATALGGLCGAYAVSVSKADCRTAQLAAAYKVHTTFGAPVTAAKNPTFKNFILKSVNGKVETHFFAGEKLVSTAQFVWNSWVNNNLQSISSFMVDSISADKFAVGAIKQTSSNTNDRSFYIAYTGTLGVDVLSAVDNSVQTIKLTNFSSLEKILSVDINQDGLDDLVFIYKDTTPKIYFAYSISERDMASLSAIKFGNPVIMPLLSSLIISDMAVGRFVDKARPGVAIGTDQGVMIVPALDQSLTAISSPQVPRQIIVGDFNKDQLDDLIVLTENGMMPNVYYYQNVDGKFSITGVRTIQRGSDPGINAESIAAVDLNCDGVMDLAYSEKTSHRVGFFFGESDPSRLALDPNTLPPPALDYSPGSPGVGVTQLSSGDLNGDGRPDLLLLTSSGATVGLVAALGQ